MTAAVSSVPWTPKLVEDLLFRQFCKGEDVSSLLPVIPPAATPFAAANSVNGQSASAVPFLELDDALRALIRFSQNGPSVAGGTGGAPLSQRTAMNAPGTPGKGPTTGSAVGSVLLGGAANTGAATTTTPRTPISKPPLGTAKVNTAAAAPVAVLPAPSPGAASGAVKREPLGAVKATSPSVMTAAASSSDASRKRTRERLEWPATVPYDSALVSKSRSAVQHLTERRIAAQDGVDPDAIFRQPVEEFPIGPIFSKNHPDAVQELLTRTRGLSGDWRQDTFSLAEETLYKQSLGFTVVGPSQCQPTNMVGGCLVSSS